MESLFTRSDAVARLAKLFAERKGQFIATHVQDGDLGEVESIQDQSEPARSQATLIVTMKSGRIFTLKGSAYEQPTLFENYFNVKFEVPRGRDFQDCAGRDSTYAYSSVEEGTIPSRIELADGGYESYSGEMSVASPSTPSLLLTLVDTGAAAFNKPIIEAFIKRKTREAGEKEERIQAIRAQEEQARLEGLETKRSELNNQLEGCHIGSVQLIGQRAEALQGLTLLCGSKTLTVELADRAGQPVLKVSVSE
ncbi:hypothetical protein KBA73_01115 [Patescibacteria group bacterium]|nr:hypothetical protein [Patescibacteria group bacterium]